MTESGRRRFAENRDPVRQNDPPTEPISMDEPYHIYMLVLQR
jgi:hypothetical protein